MDVGYTLDKKEPNEKNCYPAFGRIRKPDILFG